MMRIGFIKKSLRKIDVRFQLVLLNLLVFGSLTYYIIEIGYNYPAVLKHSQWLKESPSRLKYSLGSRVYLSNVIRLPKIQYDFLLDETAEEKHLRESRRDSIKNGFLHAWNGYTRYAWGYDELLPLTNVGRNNFNGWGATIIDALDTLWIMDLKKEFNRSRDFVRSVDFTKSNDDINVFETTIRYLGGLLSAYELSNDLVFLEKAQELGNALLPSFDSPTGLPYNWWNLTCYKSYKDFLELGAETKTTGLETLKYLYLLFSPPDVISLDTYVFNTEAHPLFRMIKPL
ncbi:Glycoside Hydrolase Family 47 protein [Gigaspora rosea]|uniref:alpha-1,2-Mannosidase n=1 Tax=Gigaspora rosea TaxID=44941 RepID=A0A397VPI7_9GLOM|nr:Glycoside Hydrolase Family 47 protein [Gigaspora rosea]